MAEQLEMCENMKMSYTASSKFTYKIAFGLDGPLTLNYLQGMHNGFSREFHCRTVEGCYVEGIIGFKETIKGTGIIDVSVRNVITNLQFEACVILPTYGDEWISAELNKMVLKVDGDLEGCAGSFNVADLVDIPMVTGIQIEFTTKAGDVAVFV